jgi:hypothetical protein
MLRTRFLPAAGWLAWGLLCSAALTVQAGEDEAGVVHIRKPAATVRAQSDGIRQAVCETGMPGGNCPTCPGGAACPMCNGNHCAWRTSDFGGYGSRGHGCWHGKHGSWCDSHDCTGQDMINYFRCKFGYFIPTGCGGAGCPPCGKYGRVYPLDPNYFDQRDGQAWAAQGYGVPVAVPLAPVVAHQWNYSWGTPASRLTPISRIAPY